MSSLTRKFLKRSPTNRKARLKVFNYGLLLYLVYGEFSLMLTGDVGEAVDQEMTASGRSLSAVVCKSGHHWAKSSSCKPFLEAVNPQYVVVSVGAENRYGHPHPEFLDRAADVGAAVLRTDVLGTIEVISNEEQMWWESHQ
jgi:competence protein ComEC